MFEYYHLSVLVDRQADKYGDRTILRYRDYETDRWLSVSWKQFAAINHRTAEAMAAFGVREEENVAIFSQNKPECFYMEYGCYMNRAVAVPVYATSSKYQLRYILNEAEIRLLFVGEQQQYDIAMEALPDSPCVERLVLLDKQIMRLPDDTLSVYFEDFLNEGTPESAATVAERTARASNDDLANILYTSGTTGEPKGVMLHHTCYLECFRIHDIRLEGMNDTDVSMNFLPLTHVFEKAWCHLCIHKGVEICVNLRPTDIQNTIKEIRPTMMCNVPRFWEKVYAGVQEKINNSRGLMQRIMKDAVTTGRIYNVECRRVGKTPPLWIRWKYAFYNKTVYQVLKKTIGVERGRLFPTAGAAIPDAVYEFVRAVGIQMIAGYGLTESTATVSCAWGAYFCPGSVGTVMPDVQVRISDSGEVLLRGKTISKGYYKKPAETAAAIDADGWFHTGDLGRMEGNELFLGERIKDLFKTSNGKYIAPQALELKLVVDKYVDQIAIIADGRKFVSALIVPDYGMVEEYANKQGIVYSDRISLLAHPDVRSLFESRIAAQQETFNPYERIKRFTLLAHPFNMEKGELTNTLKLKRRTIAENY
ncbi:MAG: long-chain fatty acid--CoA ligase, partial [Prevotellaceae bacterium]|nr:long-chain fatty acid--CoA ligase [Prevotellaceae bacterium]